jgi:hypothetical protein
MRVALLLSDSSITPVALKERVWSSENSWQA